MAARKPKKQPIKRRRTVKNEEHTELEMYCIWLNEYYQSLLKSGFKSDIAMAFVMDKASYPPWVQYKPTEDEIRRMFDEGDGDE